MQTPGQVSRATGISRYTIYKAVEREAFPVKRVLSCGRTYYEVDTETPEFKQWITGHPKRKRPNAGRKKKIPAQIP